MGFCSNFMFLSIAAAASSVGYFYYILNKPPDSPLILEDKYWGPGVAKPDDVTIKQFKVNVPDLDLVDLKNRLNRWRPPVEALEGVGFQYGFHKTKLVQIIEYWKTKYDWKSREKLLNSFPQFITQISGLDIHFLHVKPKQVPKGVEVVPLLLLHGWPGSVKEFYKMIPLLTSPRPDEHFVFEVIAPSLPGYGWSQGSSKTGLSTTYVGLIMNKLMTRLGFNKYYVQGGDWGSVIGAEMSVNFPQSILGYHSNMCVHLNKWYKLKMYLGMIFPWLSNEEPPSDGRDNQIMFMMEETGYMHLQATKPDTVGAALSDSPVGLAAYILEKFSTWTNPSWKMKQDGGLSNYQLDDLLDNVMIYWLSNSITTSMRLYAESFNKYQQGLSITQYPITVPTGCARFPSELVIVQKSVIEQGYQNLIRFTDMPKGGHFAAFEVPELLGDEIWKFTSAARNYYKQKEQEKKKELEEKEKQKKQKTEM